MQPNFEYKKERRTKFSVLERQFFLGLYVWYLHHYSSQIGLHGHPGCTILVVALGAIRVKSEALEEYYGQKRTLSLVHSKTRPCVLNNLLPPPWPRSSELEKRPQRPTAAAKQRLVMLFLIRATPKPRRPSLHSTPTDVHTLHHTGDDKSWPKMTAAAS